MVGQQSVFSRMGQWLRRNQAETETAEKAIDVELDVAPEAPPVPAATTTTGGGNGDEPRRNFLTPWGKRDQAIDNLQRGLGALSELLVSIRDNMDRQSQRQEELLGYMATLPQALAGIPEGNRVQAEAFKALQQQIEKQTTQQSKLGEVLERISQADNRQGRTLEALQQTVSAMSGHDEAISHNLQTLGTALASMSENSQSSARVLEQLKDNTELRDGELEKIIKRQNTRFTTLLSVAIVISIAALTTVSVVGYLAYDLMSKTK